MRKLLLFIFFSIQVICIAVQLNRETKFFNWSMYHTIAEYVVTVVVDDKILTESEFNNRYQFPNASTEGRSLDHLKRKLIMFERLYGNGAKSKITIDYVENLKSGKWEWSNY